MDNNFYHAITGGFPNPNVVFDGQGELQQPVFKQSNLGTQSQLWEPGHTHSTTASQQDPHNVTYETVMQDIAAVLIMIPKSRKSISEAMYALEKTTEDLKNNIEKLGEFGGLSMYTIAYISDLHMDNSNTLEQHRNLWSNFNYCWLSAFQKYIDYPINDLDTDRMEKMGQIVIEFADYVEPYGLVDYQMGFWEEEILDREKWPIYPCFIDQR
ncbi:hypothetical protein EYB25_003225 [Talaromyces marneffei]|nr:hypothetical protein EYB25_003225 [Talaromyces marneffei]